MSRAAGNGVGRAPESSSVSGFVYRVKRAPDRVHRPAAHVEGCSRIEQVERLLLDRQEVAREARERGVEVGLGMRLDRVEERAGPGSQMGVEEAALRCEVGGRGVIAGDEVA